MRKILSVVIVCFMIVSLFSGCSLFKNKDKNNDELTPVSSIAMNEDEAQKLTDKVPVRLYFADENNTKLKLEVRYIPMAEAKKSVNNLATIIVQELINGPKTSGLNRTIPQGVKMGAKVKVDPSTGIATVDFTNSLIDKHPGGRVAEQLTIYSIVNSLTELKDVQAVRFTINGKKKTEFKGNYKFDSAFPRTESLINKEVPTVGSGTDTFSQEAKDTKDTKNTKDTKDSKDAKDTKNIKDTEKSTSSITTDDPADVETIYDMNDDIEVVDGEPLE